MRITRVVAGGQAAKAGLRVGDIVLAVDGVDLRKDPQAFIAKVSERIGQTARLSIKRGAQEMSSDVDVGTRTDSIYKLVELPNASADQIKIREAWLKIGK